MWVYEKKLQYPVKIKQTNPKLAKIIITQYGGLYCKKIYKKPPVRTLKILTGGIIICDKSDLLLPELHHKESRASVYEHHHFRTCLV